VHPRTLHRAFRILYRHKLLSVGFHCLFLFVFYASILIGVDLVLECLHYLLVSLLYKVPCHNYKTDAFFSSLCVLLIQTLSQNGVEMML